MGSQRFCLRWNNHQSNLLSVFDQLLHDEAFVDVTLAVEGQFLRAHKMVLSACSPYFQALFVGHPDKHPIVILKDVPFADMRSLLDFMYRGEVSVDQDRLTAFLKVAESLRIKGLTEVNEERCDLPSIANSLLNQSLPPPPPPNLHRISQHHLHHQQQLQQHYQQQQVSQLTPPPQQQQQQLQQQQQQQQSSQNNKRLAPNPYQIQNAMLNSALTAPKRKRGRPRKLSGSNPGTPNPHASDDQDDVRVNNIDNHLEGSEAKNGPSVPESNHCSSPRENGGSGGEESSASVSIGGPPLSSSSPKTATTTTVVGGPEEDHGEEDLKTPPRSPASLAIDAMSLSVVVKSEVKQEMTVTNRGGGGGGVRDQEDEPMDASDIEHETDEYNNYVKTERDGSKPSTSGQDNVPAYHGPTTDGMERFAALDGILRGSHPESDTSPREDDSDSDSLIVDGYNESDRDVENNNDVGESDVPLDNSSAGAEGNNHRSIGGVGDDGGGGGGAGGGGGTAGEFTEPACRPPVARRRVRRRTTSSTDPTEALTEMSVRGLNLFRYASITEGVYKCMECAKADVLKTFKNKYSFQRHAFLYHEGHQRKVFPCPVCSKEFSRPDKMKNHMKMVHDCFMPKEIMFPPVGYFLPP